MKITIVAVGKLKEKYFADGIAEYKKRLTPFCKLESVEIAEEKVPEAPSEKERQLAVEAEGERLLKRLPKGAHAFALDLHGKAISSEEMAARFAELNGAGVSHFAFVIGGPFGLADSVRERCENISFSRLTFTHQMIRLILTEQIYRAFKINRGEKYHW